jgi:RimJ/RimL family protein N-acetyltransferase
MLRIRLSDGTAVRIRPVVPADKPRLAEAMAKLSAESVRRRFLAAKPSLSAAELRYLTEVDGSDHIALVAVLDDDPDRVAAVARCVRTEPGGDTAEFAIVVGDALQARGLGTALAAALAQRARSAGIRRFEATTLAENEAVQHLIEGFAAQTEQRILAGGVREIVAELADCEPLAA